jgi:hypothetical protein
MLTSRPAGSLPKGRSGRWKDEPARPPEGRAAAEYYKRAEANPVKAGLCPRPEGWEFGSVAARAKESARFL